MKLRRKKKAINGYFIAQKKTESKNVDDRKVMRVAEKT